MRRTSFEQEHERYCAVEDLSYLAGIVVNEVNSEPLVHIVIIQFLKRKTSKMVDIGKMAVENTKLMAYIIL